MVVDRDRQSAAQRGTWIGVKPLAARREQSPETFHYALTWTAERAVAVCGEVIAHPVILQGSPPEPARHRHCDEIARANPSVQR
jgi:hypothetical protein